MSCNNFVRSTLHKFLEDICLSDGEWRPTFCQVSRGDQLARAGSNSLGGTLIIELERIPNLPLLAIGLTWWKIYAAGEHQAESRDRHFDRCRPRKHCAGPRPQRAQDAPVAICRTYDDETSFRVVRAKECDFILHRRIGSVIASDVE